jgi:hypothetical protein
VRSIQTLKTINFRPADEFWRAFEAAKKLSAPPSKAP